MTAAQLLELLKQKKVSLAVSGDDLVVRGPKQQLDGLTVDAIRHHKAHLIEILSVDDHANVASDEPIVPPNGIPDGCDSIEPSMLRLIDVSKKEIERIVAAVPGGALNIADIYPLGPLQEGMLFHHLLEAEYDPYVEQSLYRFADRKRLDAYLSALQAVIDRHDILRTAVLWDGLREPVQVVLRKAHLPIEEVTLCNGDAADELAELFNPRHCRLDVRQAPIMRVAVARDMGRDSWVMVLLTHHLIVDHVTADVMREEILAHLHGEVSKLPVPVPFRNYIAQVRRGVSQREHETHFKSLLADVDEPTAPFGLVSIRDNAWKLVESEHPLCASLVRRIRSRARELNVSVASLCHLAWAHVVSQTSGRHDVVFGTVLFGRIQAGEGLERATGLFINTLPVRVDVDERGVDQMLVEMHAQLARLLHHEHASLSLAQRCSGVAAPAPLFTSLLNYRHITPEAREVATEIWEDVQMLRSEGHTNYPIKVAVNDLGDSIILQAQVEASLCPRRICALMETALELVVDALETRRSTPLRNLRGLPVSERQLVVMEWNATDLAYAGEKFIHELFEAQVAERPDAVALVYEGQQLGYGELDARANRLAHYLHKEGVRPETRVALCTERSLEMVVGLLAILKAGGAYVPLDPSYPLERLRYLLEDCAPTVVLTHSAVSLPVRGLLDEHCAVVISLDDDEAWTDESSSALARDGLRAQHAAYVIYTSGSTGRPKGVVVEHRSVANFLNWLLRVSGLAEGDVGLQKTPFSFDASIREIFPPLLSGAKLVIARAGPHRDMQYLVDIIREQRVTTLHFVPSMLQVLIDGTDAAGCSSVRHVFCGGEALNGWLVERVCAAWPEVTLWNLYGPTETAVDVTDQVCTHEDDVVLPIGRPLPNTRTYILDAYGDPVPIGVAGELYIGGVQVARGYLNRAELTAERFVPDPFGGAGARLYRTGDLARYRNDGTLEFLGRGDFQVKIRGFRIELGEIEGRLREHPDVREAVVVAREDTPGDKRLVAYYTGAEGAEFGASELRAHLQAVLPEYMVPAAYVALEQLPLLPNGKLDRRSLPAPDGAAYTVREYEAPVGEIEETLASIWRELLKLERVGRHDNFFELGGHSLLAVRLLSRIRQALHVDIGLTELFTRPTLSGFAQALRDARHATSMPIVAVERTQRLPLSFAQQRLWFLAQLEGGSEAYHIPFGIRLRGRLDQPALSYALNRIIARHEVLRTAFAVIDGEPEQYIAPPEIGFMLLEHDLRDRADASARCQELIEQEAAARFDLKHGPLIRGRLIALGAEEHVLLLTMHHIVSDGWSMGVFMRELSTLYEAYHTGVADPLPALPVQYVDYAIWQRRWLSGDVLQAQTSYWQQALSSAPPLLELPWDRARPEVQDHCGDTVRFDVDAELSAKLRALSRRHGTTMFMTLLTAWGALLSRLSGQSEVVIGTPVANRMRPEIEELIGFFVNTLALRLDYSGTPTVEQMLERVKEVAILAQEHQDLPFEQVVELLNPPRSLAHTPIFQTMFSWQPDETNEPLSLKDLKLSALENAAAGAQFDLSLALFEVGDHIAGGLRYASTLLGHSTVERWARYLRDMLTAMATDETQLMDRIGILGASERQLVVMEWNATDLAYAGEKFIHELFEAQVAERPDAVALVYEGQQLGYGELDARANRLAHYLHKEGVRPETRVALCTERSLEMVVGLLAILKAGGAYVPLDPSYPLERLRYLLEDCAPTVVLTHSAVSLPVRGLLDEHCAVVISLDDDEAWTDESSSALARDGLRAQHAAYVIYTSGSTGRPKGVVVEHRQLTRKLLGAKEGLDVGEDDVVPNLGSYAFDISLLELLTPLIAGGATSLVAASEVMDVERLIERTDSATIFHAVPSLMAAWLEALGSDRERYGALRTILVGGEAVPESLLRKLRTRFPQVEIVELYGPTEATIISTAYNANEDPVHVVPHCIGHPLANTRTYILDAYGDPMPIGVAGELYIGGVQVARGYLNRPELTAERFVPDPFEATGARLYGTGDLARYLPDGNIEFLGRRDFQVKIRGFRIELGEIEARLHEHPDVREAVVVAREDTPGDKRLVAYYTADEQEANSAELREHLLSVLPEYMVPAVYVPLDRLPLTSNGKLDRKALPAPDGAARMAREYEAPVGEIEEALAQIWCELLGVQQVGRHDNFFESGGHSLLGLLVLSRSEEIFSAEIGLTELFASPTLSAFAEVVQRSRGGALESIPLVPIDRNQPLPLSFAQQRLWFLAQLEGGSEAYHISLGVRLQGVLDRAAFRQALDRIVARHESLRTTFASIDGEPVQQIAPADVGFALGEHDLRDRPDAVQQLIDQEASAPFDLERGPLIRGRLIALADDEHVLLVTMHHIVSDGWSMGVFMRELSTLYTAFSRGRDDPLSPLSLQYADYAVWQRRWLSGDVLQAQTSYWREALSGAPVLLELPWDRPRPVVQDYHGEYVRIELDAELSAGLRALSRRHGTTLFMTLLSAWGALVSRLSGQSEVVIGTPVANRTRPEIEELIGFFVNTLALRLDYSGSPPVSELLERVKMVALSAQEHQDVPFEQVVELLNPPRSLSHTPLFQTMFSWQEGDRDGNLRLKDLELSPAGAAAEVAKFDLLLALSESRDAIGGELKFARSLFDRTTVERWAGYLPELLSAMVADDARRIDGIGVLPAAEREQLVEWNATDRTYASDVCVHELFDAQVVQRPDAVAIVYEDAQLSYGELDVRANRLAHYLRTLGVGPDRRVALCLERSVELIVSILAVLKAGGAYVPLDPSYPSERLQYMLSDCAPVAVLTHGAIDPSVRALLDQCDVPTIDLDDAAAWAGQPSSAPKRADLCPSHAAYVIYTSGSTGRPKGVIVEHRSLVNLLLAIQAVHELCRNSAVLQKNQLTFDPAVQEILQPLVHGARLVLARAEGHKDPRYLAEVIRAERITTLHFVPSMLELFVEQEQSSGCTSLQRITCGGEALPGWLAVRCLERLPWVELVNFYGPAEATVDATTWSCARSVSGGSIPIGRPIGNVRTYVLDAYGDPVPIGVAGELYIGGVQVARGYLNRAELTAERFVPDPFGGAGARLYRTGDLARYRNDGTLEFLGRGDFQVKIRGFRIELGEIEGRLREHPDVREAVVVAREDTPGDKRLVAYYTGAEGAEFGASELRAHLQAVLPEYMVPGAYVALEQLPLLPNGKLDRRSLPAPDGAAYTVREYEAPVGEIEETLASIWRELLGVQRVGRHDNFFQLGGHSLLAVRLLSRVRQGLQLEANLSALFLAPTLSAFAEVVQRSRGGALESIPLVPIDRNQPLPLSFAQQRLWFLAQLEGGSEAYHISLGVRLQGVLDRAAFRQALDRIVARHESLRTTFASIDGEPVQQIAPADVGFALGEHDLRDRPDAVQQLIDQEASAPFDLERGPLIRGRLIALADDEHVLLVTMHHIVSDGWSMGVFMRELSTLYTAFSRGRDDPLSPLSLQYADYAVWQRRWLSGDVLQAQTSYWREALSGAPVLLELPWDRPRPVVQDYHGEYVRIELDAELSAGLRALSRRHGTTLFMTLLSAWGALVSRLSGQSEVVIGTPVANRTRPEIEELIGFFVNTLALRLDYSGSPPVSELLERVKMVALSAQEHQDVPFEQVVELLNPPRSLSHTPLFQTMFVWEQDDPGERVLLPNMTTSWSGASAATSKFDVSLTLFEDGELISGGLRYASALFDRTTVERWAGYLPELLSAMVADDARRIDGIGVLPAAEREQLVEWNATDRTYASDVCVHELFDAQVVQRPDAVAIVYEDAQLSYGELDARANRLAHYLRTLGVGPDRRVALCLERSVELIVSILAVLKAGGAYVPLDPSYPSERLQYMLDDSAPVAVLTHGAIDPSVRALLDAYGAPTIDLDDDAAWADEPSTAPSRDGLTPRHAAYVIYTSGSTGRPKGVIVEHGNVTRLFGATQRWFAFGPTDVWTLFHSFAFDFSVWELFGALLYGGRLVIVPHLVSRSPEAFYDLLCQVGVTVLNQTPSAFGQLIEAQRQSSQEHALHCVIFGGEALDTSMLAPWYEDARNGSTRLINMYGITETTVHVTYREVGSVSDRGVLGSLIGERIADLQVYVLDSKGNLAPIGVPGELYVGGGGVARGYLNRAELTAERFVPDPFGGAGARLYRTGDLARYRNDGTLEFLGRGDFQVKIRGFRIELGEIEGRLREHPDVREAVVVAREDTPGDKRLVAYYTGAEGAEFGASELRAHLQAVLPEYMVPGAYVALEQLPLLPNGKLDRRSLPAPDGAAYTVREYEAPVGEIEEALASIWRELLKLERVGRHDNFFQLGGHSLLVVRAIERMRRLGLYADVATFFTAPSLAGVAAMVRTQSAAVVVPPNGIVEGCEEIEPWMVPLIELDASEIDRIVAAVPGGTRNIADIYPLAPLQEGILFHHLLESGRDPYVLQSVYRFADRAKLDAYLAALQVVIDRHDVLRTAVVWEGLREPVQVVWRRAPLSVEEIVVGEGEDAVAALSARFDLQTYRLDVGRAPIMHAVISFDGHRNTWILMLFRHHVTGDHVTVELIHEEIRSRLAGEGALLPPSVPFRNFIAHARLSVHRDADEAYFRGLLGDVDWPTAPFGLLNVHRDGAAIREAKQYLQPPLSQKLRARARGTGVSAASLCHLAWGLVLSRLTGQDDVVFGTVLFGRMQGGESADRAMGLFMNTLPVRICIDERALDRAVAETHAQLASSLMHEHASLTLAQRCSAVPAPKPLFSTLFNYRHIARASDSERDIGDWDGTTVVEGQERTNYPITLSFNDYGDDFSFSAQVDPLVDPSRICSFMLTAISEIIEALESAPSSLLRNVNAIPAAELSTVLRDWNSTDKTYPRGRCVHELFEANAESSPDAVAVTGADTSITYAELNDRANRLARFLYNRGIGPSSRVAIIGPPSVATIAARLATLKTGAAYVCVPRSSSSDWTRRILLHSRAEVILADGRIKSPPGEVEELPAGKPLDLHADAALWENEPTSNLSRPQLTSQLLALVQYQIQKGDATPVSDHANHIQEHVFRNK